MEPGPNGVRNRPGPEAAHEEIVEVVLDDGGFIHGHTYAGNPLACAAGLAVVEEIERQGLMQNALTVGGRLESRLKSLMNRYPIIGDVRGMGLLQGFELVADRATMEPLPKELNAHDALVGAAYDNGLIIYSCRSRGGHSGDHFLVAPPMITTNEQVDEIIDKLTTALDRFIASSGLS